MTKKNYWILEYNPLIIDDCLEQATPGLRTLPELLGDAWRWVLRKTRWGRLFRLDVLAGRFPRLRWVKKRSDKKQLYELTAA